MSGKIFKKDVFDSFFTREMREVKVVEFINLTHGGNSVLEYLLKFVELSKYASSLVYDPRDEMSCFVMVVSDNLKEEYHSSMLH